MRFIVGSESHKKTLCETLESKIGQTLGLVLFVCLITIVGGMSPAMAQKSASSVNVKVGYFNLALVKATYPEAADSENLRVQADNQLKRDVEAGNKRVEQAKADKKPNEEVQKLVSQLQTEINAKQQALVQLIQTSQAQATQRILQAVNQVASDKGLDLVVDAGAVFAGGQKVVDNGVDVTEDVMKKLQVPSLGAGKNAQASANTSKTTTK